MVADDGELSRVAAGEPRCKARNEMLMAVNSLPVSGRKYHHRILVSRIKTLKKELLSSKAKLPSKSSL